MKPKVIDLFSGCGGLSYGFEEAGFEVIGFVEYWKPAIDTFLRNHKAATHIGEDITKISDEAISHYKGKVDVIIGGPPCQGFSQCGKRNPKDGRNQLYKHYLRFVKIIDPKHIVMENVSGLLSMTAPNGRKFIDNILHDLIKLGYSVSYRILTASEFGVAQKRQRLVVIAEKKNLYPKPNGIRKNLIDAIRNIPQDANGHDFFETQEETLSKIKELEQGERLCKTYNFSRQRVFADKPCRTVTTKPLFIHPFEDRFLTARELARLQSFPDTFEFSGSRTSMVKQIGNAVPPILASAIATQIKEVAYND